MLSRVPLSTSAQQCGDYVEARRTHTRVLIKSRHDLSFQLIQNDVRIKSCIERYDNGAYSRLQFLKAISHSLRGFPGDVR